MGVLVTVNHVISLDDVSVSSKIRDSSASTFRSPPDLTLNIFACYP